MALELDMGEKKPVTNVTIGSTTILQYPVYSNGTYGQPKIIRSYNFVPQAVKKRKERQKTQIVEEETGEM